MKPIGFLSLLCAFSCLAQTHPPTSPAHAAATKQLQIVAGIVSSDGTVKYLPRVQISLMPKRYQDAEAAATTVYKSAMDTASAARESKVAILIRERRENLEEAQKKYAEKLSTALQKVTITPLEATPSCVTAFAFGNQFFPCMTPMDSSVHLSEQFKTFLTSDAILGTYKPDTFSAKAAPAASDLKVAMAKIPFTQYMAIPEFANAAKFVVKRNSKELKNTIGTNSIIASNTLPDNVSTSLSAALANVWVTVSEKAATDFSSSEFIKAYFHGLPSGVVPYLLNAIEKKSTEAVDSAKLAVLQEYITAKDSINLKYDALQHDEDDRMNAASDVAESHLSEALSEARKNYRPLQEATTSLEGQATINVPASGGVLYAEDVTTDRHLKWEIPIATAKLPKTLELSDSNAVPVTPRGSTAVAQSAQKAFPVAANLTGEQRDEYHLRYGTRLMKRWEMMSKIHNLASEQQKLILDDTPLGFGFFLSGRSTDVFNTLRMDDNKIAVRFFKDLVIPYLQEIPDSLTATGGQNAFEAVTVSIVGSKKDFSNEYAIGDLCTFEYIFRISDVESFVAQKIDTQQLLDRGHISEEGVGRISLKYNSAE